MALLMTTLLLKMAAFRRKVTVKESIEMPQNTDDSGDDGETGDKSWI